MKPFDKKIDRFSGWNRHKRQPFLSKLKSGNFPLSFTEKGLKRKENELWYQNIMFNNYRDRLPNSLKSRGTKMNF